MTALKKGDRHRLTVESGDESQRTPEPVPVFQQPAMPAPSVSASVDSGRSQTESSLAPEDDRLTRYAQFDRCNGPYLDWQVAQFQDVLGQRILEIGTGVGGIIERLGARELIVGTDVEPEILESTRRRFSDRPDCRFELIDVFSAPAGPLEALRACAFDTIVCINVLEHISDDAAALGRMEQLLAPGGRVALLVPAHPTLYGEYDRIDGHYRRYSRRMLREAVSKTGLRIVRMHYFNAVGAIGWWVQYRLLRRSIHRPGHFRVMNALLPVLRRLEGLRSPPFGLSLVAILERPGPDGPQAAMPADCQ